MRISIAEAQGRLAELVKRAEQGEEVVLTQPGLATVKLTVAQSDAEGSRQSYDAIAELEKFVPLASGRAPLSTEEKEKVFAEIRRLAAESGPFDGTDAAHSQDFLYDDFGLPK